MEKLITIAIPTYNMERYIGHCLDSLLIGEGFEGVEVLVINDGSKDRSSEIAHGYADRYPGSIRVIDKENGNYGSCVNRALKEATGRYIKILDADDTFDTDNFRRFVADLPNRHEDVLFTDMLCVDEKGGHIMETTMDWGLPANITFDFDGIASFITNGHVLSMHNIAVRRAVFSRFSYKQLEGISYTDNQWTKLPIAYSNSFRYVACGQVYIYLIGRPGQTVDPSVEASRMGDYISLCRKLVLDYEEYSGEKVRKEYLLGQTSMLIYCVYLKALDLRNDRISATISDLDRWIAENSRDVWRNLPETYRLLSTSSKIYNKVDDWRRCNFSASYKMPLWAKLEWMIWNFFMHKVPFLSKRKS